MSLRVRYVVGVRIMGLAVAFVLTASGCGESTLSTQPVSLEDCEGLFGTPGENTGLSEQQCRPYCEHSDGTRDDALMLTAAGLDRLGELAVENPRGPLSTDIYAEPAPEGPSVEAACGVLPASAAGTYRLVDYDSIGQLRSAGATLTHRGRCGLCSPLSDFAVYAKNPDLTTPVRQCGLMGLSGDDTAVLECLKELGFSDGCADVWARNTKNTSEVCLEPCLEALGQPYHDGEGDPNACIGCDEEMSGAVFKYYAGRTRRNTGLASALCRPWSEVTFIEHDYSALF